MRNTFAARLLAAAVLLTGGSAATYAQDSCDATSFNGAFGFTMKGFVYDSRGNMYILASAGRLVSDGGGTLTGSDTVSYDGQAVRRKLTGTYSVNADCTGTLVLNGDDTSITNADFVIVNDGKEISLVQTDANFVMSGELKRQKAPAAATTEPAPSTPTQ